MADGTNLDVLKNKLKRLKEANTDITKDESVPSRNDTESKNETGDLSVPSRNTNVVRQLKSIKIDDIKPNPFQPRKVFTGIEELANSIEEKGLLQPVVVIKIANEYILIAGERRLKASSLIQERNPNYTHIDAVEMEIDGVFEESELELLAAIENIQRKDMTVIDTANMYKRISNSSYSEISKALGISKTSIARYIKISSLPEEIKEMLNKDDLKATNKIELLVQLNGNITKQKELVEDIIKDEPLIRIEKKIRDILNGTIKKENNQVEIVLSLLEEIKPTSKVISKAVYRKLDVDKRSRVDDFLNTILEAQKGISEILK